MFSCEICEIFKNTFFLKNNSSGCYCKELNDFCFPVYLMLLANVDFLNNLPHCSKNEVSLKGFLWQIRSFLHNYLHLRKKFLKS